MTCPLLPSEVLASPFTWRSILHLSNRAHRVVSATFGQFKTATLALLLFCGLDAAWAQTDPMRIDTIVIEGNQRTDEDIIRRELLFAVSEPVDTTLFAESERNLRRLFFIGEVRIHSVADSGHLTVIVYVEDLYSRALSPLLSGQKNELSYGLAGLDYNLFGRGQSLQATVEKRAISGLWAETYFAEPRLSGTRHSLSGQLGAGTEGHAHSLEFARPFATLADPQAYGLSISSHRSLQRLYDNGQLNHRYSDSLHSGRFWFVRSFGHRLKIRPSLQLSISQRRFAALPPFSYAPSDRTRIIPSTTLLIWRPNYQRSRFVHDLGPLEDLQTGSWLSLSWGLAHSQLGSDRTFTFCRAQIVPSFQPSDRTFAQLNLYASTRQTQSGLYNISARASLMAYTRIQSTHSIALHISWEALHRSEDASQLLLGLERGLRGFTPRRFDGTRRLLINVEGRPTLIRNPWYVLAAAVFLDFGSAWTPATERPDLRFAPGFGLRLGLPRVYNTPVFRSDLAYGIGGGAWQLSLGLGQYF